MAPGDGSWSLSGVLDLGQELFGGTGTSGHPHVYPYPCWPLVECSALMMTSMSLGVTKAPPALGDGVGGDVNLSSGVVCHENKQQNKP